VRFYLHFSLLHRRTIDYLKYHNHNHTQPHPTTTTLNHTQPQPHSTTPNHNLHYNLHYSLNYEFTQNYNHSHNYLRIAVLALSERAIVNGDATRRPRSLWPPIGLPLSLTIWCLWRCAPFINHGLLPLRPDVTSSTRNDAGCGMQPGAFAPARLPSLGP
jgi:hypothetical protein